MYPRSLDVTNNSDHDDGGSFNDGHSLEGFLLVELGTRTVHVSQDVSHTSLEPGEGGQVTGLGLVVTGEGSDLTVVVSGTAARYETKISVTGSFELSVRH
jgi:hypothetical protein